MSSNCNWSEGELNLLKRIYADKDIYEICESLPGRSMTGILVKAARIGLKKIKKNRSHVRKYYCDFDYFKDINSSAKAYHLGWAFTDGNVCGEQYRIRIRDYDIDVLENLNLELNSTYKIYKRGNCVEIDITNAQFVNNLIDKGCTERKSSTLSFPSIENEYFFDFIKGVFDGDGCYVCTDKTQKIGLCSASKDFLCSIRDNLNTYGIKSYVYFKSGGSYGSLEICAKKSIKMFLDKVLSTNSYFMKRKHKKMEKLLNFVTKKNS